MAILVAFGLGLWVGGSGDDGPAADLPATTTVDRSTTSFTEDIMVTTLEPPESTGSTATSSTPGTSSLPSDRVSARVVDVVDGDTIDVVLDGEAATERLRLIGINSPEGGECYAAEATAGLTDLVLGETVALERDISDRDQYGRLLRYVWTMGGDLVNEITVEEGWALAREYPPDTARADQLDEAQDRAMGAERGLWAPDACGDSVPADIRIVDIEYDAPGDDNANLDGEWVEIVNSDDLPVDLTGWVLKDESASHRYAFPSGFTLQPDAGVLVFTGCGQDSDDELYWCNSGSAVWNNDGDTAFLLDPQGNIVFSYAYG